MSERIVVDHRGAPVARTRWRTGLVLAHTLSGSARVLGRATVRRLDQDDVDRTLRRWVDHVFRLARSSVTVQGDEHVVPGQPYVLLSNHTSLIDIPAVLAAFPGRLRFVAKEELGRVPLFGRAMREAGVVLVDRHDRAKAIAQLAAVREQLGQGTSVWIAAEGGRAAPRQLGALKKGGLHVAQGLGVPILPTWIAGASDIIAPDSWASTTGQTVRVVFGPPVPTAGVALDALVAQAREALLACAARVA